MTPNYKQRAYLYAAAIVGAMALAIWLVVARNSHPVMYLAMAFICFPMAKYVWAVYRHESRNTVRRLTKALPKCGFTIEQTEWSDDKTNVSFIGKYKDDRFQILASTAHAYVDIVDLPWLRINVTNPDMPKMMESINTLNAQRVGPRVVMTQPDNEGYRNLITAYTTILPDSDVHSFLTAALIDILNRKPALHDDLQHEKPWLAKPRGPMGFVANPAPDQATPSGCS